MGYDPTADKIRLGLSVLVQDSTDPRDIIIILSEVIDDHATEYARRTGDYPRATYLLSIARALRVLESRIKERDTE